MKSLEEVSTSVMTFLVVLLIIEILYALWDEYHRRPKQAVIFKPKLDAKKQKIRQNTMNYQQFQRELSRDLDKYNIAQSDQDKIEDMIEHIVEKRKKDNDSLLNGMVKSSLSGAVRGCMTGALMGGVPGAISGAVVFAVINPVMHGLDRRIVS